MSVRWTAAWSALDVDVSVALTRVGLNDPVLMHATFDDELDADGKDSGLRDELADFLSLVRLSGEGPETTTRRLDQLEALYYESRVPADEHSSRDAATSDWTLTDDMAAYRAAELLRASTSTRSQAQAEAVATLPTQWKGKAYRRKEVPLNPAAREEAEDLATAKWSKEVLGLLLEAKDDLPFAESVRNARGGIDGASGLRCCRGLRANTLISGSRTGGPLVAG